MKQVGWKHWDTVKELEYTLNPQSSANYKPLFHERPVTKLYYMKANQTSIL